MLGSPGLPLPGRTAPQHLFRPGPDRQRTCCGRAPVDSPVSPPLGRVSLDGWNVERRWTSPRSLDSRFSKQKRQQISNGVNQPQAWRRRLAQQKRALPVPNQSRLQQVASGVQKEGAKKAVRAAKFAGIEQTRPCVGD